MNQTTVAHYLAGRIADAGVRHVFMVTGGGAMFLNDALAFQDRLAPVFCHHEQACAMAAESYARITGGLGMVNVTTGPGGINALNGVYGAWTDSVPMLVVSGQVKRATCLATTPVPGLRQLGDQEGEIIPMARGVTKYAAVVERAEDIAWHLDQALHLATNGRPGPVWLDIPIDVQSASIDPATLRRFVPPVAPPLVPSESEIDVIVRRLQAAKRPVILAGTGIRAGDALAEFETLIRRLGIPVTTAWTHDLIASDDPLFCGRPGTIGTRAGNFTVQNADLVLILGSRLNIRQVSYNWQAFAPRAFKIQVDIDPAELAKPTVKPDLAVTADLRPFLAALNRRLENRTAQAAHGEWLRWCKERLARYPTVQPRQREFNGKINPYHFIEQLFARLDGRDIVACGNATATIVPFQVGDIKPGMRMLANSGSASMGYDLPAAIGACFGAAARGAPARHLPRRRRQHHDEPAGTADHRPPRLADQDLRPEQQRLPVDQDIADEFLWPPRGLRSRQWRQLSRFRRRRHRLRHSRAPYHRRRLSATAGWHPGRAGALPVRRHPRRNPGFRTAHEFAQTRRRQHRLAPAGGHVSLPRPG
jgi:acetolactate synthase-1/2/3 large subunit